MCYTIRIINFKPVAPLLVLVALESQGLHGFLEGKDLYVMYRSFSFTLFEMEFHTLFRSCDFSNRTQWIHLALI